MPAFGHPSHHLGGCGQQGSQPRRLWLALAVAVMAILAFAPRAALAHNLPYSLASVSFPQPGVARIEVRCHLVPLVLGDLQNVPSRDQIEAFDALTPTQLQAKEAEAAAQVLGNLSVRADGQLVNDVTWSFPSFRTIADDAAAPQYNATPSPPVILLARIPLATRVVDIALPPQLGSSVLTVITPAGRQYSEPLVDGARSQAIALQAGAAWTDTLATAARFIGLGFQHILPSGLDHILFIVALAISTPRLVQLLKLATTFTVAHSITLSLAAFGVVRLPPAIVEPAIALSIAAVALLSVFRPEQKVPTDRLALVFGFGLLHGMGFASALQETGLPHGQEVPALAGFNVGIELGQIAVILAVLAVVALWRNKPFYRARIASPVNVCIAVIGLYWTVQRVIG